VSQSRAKQTLDAAERLGRTYHSAPDRELERLLHSDDVLERLAALLIMQCRAEQGETIRPYFAAARRLIHDADNTCRWQALILVGLGIQREPELVWEIIQAEGGSRDSDMRVGVATVLLEELLDAHFEVYFPMVRDRVLSGDDRFAHTVSGCWLSESSQQKRLASLLRKARRGQPATESS
jgi:hypothetical protein